MNWWEEAEARARRAKSPSTLALLLRQRMQTAGIGPEVAHLPAYDLARLHELCADLVILVEDLLLTTDGDFASMRRHGLALDRWAEVALQWTQTSAPAFNQMMDSLELEPDLLAHREEVRPHEAGGLPEEQAKVDGRYRDWHLLFERLDLKFASIGLEERVHRGLSRSLSRIYEESLVALRLVTALEKESNPRFRTVSRLLLELNTSWHFDLGLYHLGHGRLRAGTVGPHGLQTWLLLAFGNQGFPAGAKP